VANFAAIHNVLEGALNTQLNSARGGQHVWEWFNALSRIMSANAVTGTPAVYGPATVADADFVAVTAAATAVLYGAVVDNSIAAEAVFVTVGNGGAGLTPGTEHITGPILFAPAATMVSYLWPGGIAMASGIAVYAGTGTDAGLEAGTAVTGTNPTGLLVYTT